MNNKNSGFTLIEILVSLLIFSLFMASLVIVFSQQSRKSRFVKESSVLQTDAQIAFNMIKNDIYHSALGIGVDNFPIFSGDGGSDAPDTITIRAVSLGSEIPQVKWNPVIEKSSGGVFTCHLWTDQENISKDDTILILSPEKNLIFDSLVVTNAQVVDGNLVITTNNTQASSNAASILFKIPDISVYSDGIRYWIQVIDGVPVLMRGNERFLENVEDLQFAYGLDIDGDGVIENGEFTNTIDSFSLMISNFTSSTLYDRDFLIRVSLLIRTEARFPDFMYPNAYEIVENRTINFSEGERRYDRILLSTNIYPRNIRR